MTGLDRFEGRPGARDGYWPSAWPAECGGNRRQKAAMGRLDAANRAGAVVSRRDDRWNVMFVEREPGQWYLGGTMPAFSGPEPYGWVQRLDLAADDPLAAVARSPKLPCGGHVWCGSVLAHANGAVYNVNGSYLHKLDPDDLSVLAERRLPVDRSHNGMLALRDGTIVTKDLRLEGQGGTTLTRLDPESLELLGDPLVLPEGSMGRIAADVVDIDGSGGMVHTAGTVHAVGTRGGGGMGHMSGTVHAVGTSGALTEVVYVPGTEHIWRLRVAAPGEAVGGGCGLVIDEDWRPRYRHAGGGFGLAWDSCISDGDCWIMDCGDVESVRAIHGIEPNGRFDEPPASRLSWRRRAPWPGAQRLLRVSLSDDSDISEIEPFGTPGGGIIAPPVHVPDVKAEAGIAVAWDSINGGLAGVEVASRDASGGRPGEMSVAWHADIRPSMQPVVYPESGELVINDFRPGADGGPPSDDLVVVDVATGSIIDRVATGSRVANGMFLSAAGDGRVLYASTTAVALVAWS